MGDTKTLATLGRKFTNDVMEVIAKKAKISEIKVNIEITGIPYGSDEPWTSSHSMKYKSRNSKKDD